MGTLVITNTLANLAAGNQPLSKIDTNFADIVTVINGNIDAVNCPALNNKEASLGNPAVDAYVLASTVAGVRSWIAQSGAGGVATPNIEIFTSNDTWTKPASVSKVIILLYGAGGGGAGDLVGGAGGGGAYGMGFFTVTGNVTVVIGSAGSAGSSVGGNGGNGGTSSVSGGGLPANLTCGGGTGGSSTGGNGGAIGSGFSALNSMAGQRGGQATTIAAQGGDCPNGGPGGAMLGSAAGGANNGIEPGGGGSAGPTSRAGGAGAKGRAIFIYFT